MSTDPKLRALRDLLSRIDWAENMRRRVVQQAITEAMSDYWLRRAETFEWVAGERFNDPVDADTSEWAQDTIKGQARLTALACRRHAWALDQGWFDEPYYGFHEDLDNVLAEATDPYGEAA